VGRRADAHLCVSRAMQAELAQRWGIRNATVLHDRPAEAFAPTPDPIRSDLFRRLHDEGFAFAADYYPHAPDRPALIVSSTSWTADEDFSLLLDAAAQWDARIGERPAGADGRPFPSVLILLTGSGPLRANYEEQIKHLALGTICLHTAWLSAQDYPLVLGAADLGLCLHRSSSGVDLPMKVADMFGSGLPVCALDYGPCLAEQVRHGENGLLFSSSTQLANQLYDLFNGFPGDTPRLDQLRRNVAESSRQRWSAGWAEHALPLFTQL